MENPKEGTLISVDKPLFWTSFDVVAHFKRNVWPLKIGHAGTLDPMATGLLVLCTGNQTKQISTIQEWPKTYSGYFYLGSETPSFDRETAPIQPEPAPLPIHSEIVLAVQSLTGTIEQVPPMYSALKINGNNAYDLARKGKDQVLKTRQAHIYTFEIGALDNRLLPFTIECSKGTYIRAIARDLGQMLGCGAYLHQLRRTQIGALSSREADQSLWLVAETKGRKIRENLTQSGFDPDAAFAESITLQKEDLL